MLRWLEAEGLAPHAGAFAAHALTDLADVAELSEQVPARPPLPTLPPIASPAAALPAQEDRVRSVRGEGRGVST